MLLYQSFLVTDERIEMEYVSIQKRKKEKIIMHRLCMIITSDLW